METETTQPETTQLETAPQPAIEAPSPDATRAKRPVRIGKDWLEEMRKKPSVWEKKIDGKTYHVCALSFPQTFAVAHQAEEAKGETVASLFAARCAALLVEGTCKDGNRETPLYSMEEALAIASEPNARGLVKELVDEIGFRNDGVIQQIWGAK